MYTATTYIPLSEIVPYLPFVEQFSFEEELSHSLRTLLKSALSLKEFDTLFGGLGRRGEEGRGGEGRKGGEGREGRGRRGGEGRGGEGREG